MSAYRVHTDQTAPAASRPHLAAAREAFGMVPNLIGVMAEAPAVAEGYLAIGGAFAQSSLDAVAQQVVLLATSFENGCGYCMAAHSTVAGMQQMPAHVLAGLREGRTLDDPRLEALRRFTVEVVRSRGWVEQGELQRFLQAGFTPAQVLEVVLGVSQKTLSNYVNRLADTPVDEAFQAQAWERPASAPAR